MSDHEIEPIRGLPEELPEGEHILWQGEPRWRSLALRVFHIRMVLIYFGILVAWRIASMAYDSAPVAEIVASVAWLTGIGAAGLLIMAGLSWLMSTTTVYTLTNRRVVLRFGMALPMTINLPFTKISAAAVKLDRAGVGDLSLTLSGRTRIAYLVLWPHVRPWHFSPVQPALRAIPDAAAVAELLSAQLVQATTSTPSAVAATGSAAGTGSVPEPANDAEGTDDAIDQPGQTSQRATTGERGDVVPFAAVGR